MNSGTWNLHGTGDMWSQVGPQIGSKFTKFRTERYRVMLTLRYHILYK